MAGSFFRVVRYRPPTLEDFTSKAALGIPPLTPDAETLRLWSGISVNTTEAQARRLARGMRGRLGSFIAELSIPDDARVRAERTTRSPGHWTLWGEPADLLRFVVAVRPAF